MGGQTNGEGVPSLLRISDNEGLCNEVEREAWRKDSNKIPG